jgi:hypothetical protein
MIKKILIFCIVLLSITIIYIQHRYENAIGICEMVGDKKAFYQKLEIAKNENNETLTRILVIYYAHRCAKFTKNEKKRLKTTLLHL